jgi:hypothetical protein
MPLDPDKVRQVVEKADSLTKRFDALTARRAKADEEKTQRKVLRDAEEALKTSTAEARPADADRFVDQPKDLPDPWYYTDLELGYEHERKETRQGALSKEQF